MTNAKTPRRIRPDLKKAQLLLDKGKTRESMNLYQEAYNRLPLGINPVKKEIMDAFNMILANPIHYHAIGDGDADLYFLRSIERNAEEHSMHRGHAAFATATLYHSLGRSEMICPRLDKAIKLLENMTPDERQDKFHLTPTRIMTVHELINLKPSGLLSICKSMLGVFKDETDMKDKIGPAMQAIHELFPQLFHSDMFGRDAVVEEATRKSLERYILGQDRRLKSECSCCGVVVGAGDPKMKTCSRCGLVGYCSKDCQLSGWKDHKVVCRSTKELKNGDLVRLWGLVEEKAQSNGLVFEVVGQDTESKDWKLQTLGTEKNINMAGENVALVVPIELRAKAETTPSLKALPTGLMDGFSSLHEQLVISSVCRAMKRI